MRYAFALLLALIAAAACSQKASAVESAREPASYCQKLERGTKGAAQHVQIPNTKEALLCWGYMQAMQDLSVLTYEDGTRIGIVSAGADDNAPTDPLIRDLRPIPSGRVGRQHGGRGVQGVAALVPMPLDQE
jgi:hypothetical protein